MNIDWSGSRALIEQLSHAKLKPTLKRYCRGRVIDLGCGDQPYRQYCRCREYLGIDKNSGELRGDFFRLKLGKNRADTVISTQVLEHVSEPKKLFSLVYDLLKPRGHLILATPFVWPLHDEPHDYWRFTPYGLKYLGRQAGFKTKSCVPLGGYIALVWQLLAIALERPAYGARFGNRIYKVCLRAFFRLVQPAIFRLDQKRNLKGAALVYLLVAQKTK
jgi:SAM-dependent methyltransferase